MEYINHIGKYTDSQAVADAIEAGTLASPYVVQIDGSNYYDNYPEPEPAPSTMGTWSDDGEGNYTFQIAETDTSYWEDNPTYIGQLNSVFFDGAETDTDMDITFEYNSGMGGWLLKFNDNSGGTNIPEHTFENGEPDIWDGSGVMTDPDDSDSALRVNWDGTDTLSFYTLSSEAPVSISTYDPDYPAGE